MKVVITGGGTGGHIYPALEVGRLAREQGADLLYLGSLRGQESAICAQQGIAFQGFHSAPLYSLRTVRGWQSLVGLLRSIGLAKNALRAAKPDIVFSTGGYSAAPVMSAARSLRIPYAIHEANSVPGRSNRMFGRQARAFTTTFRSTGGHRLGFPTIRTGHPIRAELRAAAHSVAREPRSILVVGGSQGSAFLNETVPEAARLLASGYQVLHASGRANFDATAARAQGIEGYHVVPYLESAELTEAYRTCTIAIGRSGGTLAEFAMFGLPSVLIPLPTSADDHQLHNAREFEMMEASTVLPQSQASPQAIADAIRGWTEAPARCERAAVALREWDVPDATQRILANLLGANK
ncbi:MAG: UDP-N-acetylglucosamine--N-acetylmuramyl-(pentapeptide) pyrophosphoryl-undecaprenol N-acetylglucosamine transferase [Fimbriimonas sp.]